MPPPIFSVSCPRCKPTPGGCRLPDRRFCSSGALDKRRRVRKYEYWYSVPKWLRPGEGGPGEINELEIRRWDLMDNQSRRPRTSRTSCRSTSEGWRSRDLQRVADQWDPDGDEVSYVADELAEVLHDRPAVVDHLSRTEQRLGAAKMDLSEITVQPLGDEFVLTTFVCRWEFEWVSHSRVSRRPPPPRRPLVLRPLHGVPLS